MKKNLYIMYAIALLQGMVFYCPISTLYRQVHGISMFQLSVIESISFALCIILEIPWGMAADRIGYRATMIFCSILYFISKIIFWTAGGFCAFLAERILLSIVVAGFSGVDSSILYLSAKDTNSQKVFGIYHSMGMAGLLLAAVIFSLFVKTDYRLSALLTVFSYGLAALLSFGLSDVPHPDQSESAAVSFPALIHLTFHNPLLFLFLLASAFLSETHQCVTVFLNQLQYIHCGMNHSDIGIVYIAVTLAGLAGFFSAGITRRIGILSAMILFCCSAVFSCLILGSVQSTFPSVAGILILRMSNALFQPLQKQLMNQQIKQKNRATVLSLYNMLMNSIAIAINLVFGILADQELHSAFFFGAFLCSLSLVFLLIWSDKQTGRYFHTKKRNRP